MRAELLTSVAVAALLVGTPALAGSPTPVYNWTGFYVGANLGGVSVQNDSQEIGPNYWFDAPPAPVYGASATGVIGGIHGGYNWQVQSLVFGLEGDLGFSSADATSTHLTAFNTSLAQTAHLGGLATLRGRIGLAFDSVLIYATGGFAAGHINDRVVEPGAPAIVFDSTGWRTGWIAGGGLEYAFARNWTVKAEGLYADFGSTDAPMLVDPTYRFRFKDTATIGRVGFNFKF